MRDPERIDEVLEALREAWLKNPDARLTQLVYNAAFKGYVKDGREPYQGSFDSFYVEDDVLLRGLRF